jgi:hypothetical protein
MQALKDELNSEEKFFENAVRTERFVKKYQKPMISSLVILLVGLGGYMGYEAYLTAKIEKANAALNTLLMNPSDQKALKELADNDGSLYDIYTLSKALKEKDAKVLNALRASMSPEVSDIATYESAVLSNDTKALEAYSKKQGSVYQELAMVELAVASIQKGDASSAQRSLSIIKEESPLYPMAQTLSHYGVK